MIDSALVTITDDAALKIKELREAEGKADQALRVFIRGGGCAGFEYGMQFEDEILADDVVSTINGVKVVIDPQSAPVLRGAEIDYVDGLMGAGFTIHNPNAVSTCACGSSFQTEEAAGHAHGGCGCGAGGGGCGCGGH